MTNQPSNLDLALARAYLHLWKAYTNLVETDVANADLIDNALAELGQYVENNVLQQLDPDGNW